MKNIHGHDVQISIRNVYLFTDLRFWVSEKS